MTYSHASNATKPDIITKSENKVPFTKKLRIKMSQVTLQTKTQFLHLPINQLMQFLKIFLDFELYSFKLVAKVYITLCIKYVTAHLVSNYKSFTEKGNTARCS